MRYAGIGSRTTPKRICAVMTAEAGKLAKLGFRLYSGGVEGADEAFERGCDLAGGSKTIFLPWRRFRQHSSEYFKLSNEAMEIGKKFHPTWNSLTDPAKKLMARNSYQILGPSLGTPVEFVLLYTPGGLGSTFDFGKYESTSELEIQKALTTFFSEVATKLRSLDRRWARHPCEFGTGCEDARCAEALEKYCCEGRGMKQKLLGRRTKEENTP